MYVNQPTASAHSVIWREKGVRVDANVYVCRNHEEESEFVYGDDNIRITNCNFGSNECAKAWR